MWSIILEDNRFKPYSTGFRKFFLLLYLLFFDLFFATIGLKWADLWKRQLMAAAAFGEGWLPRSWLEPTLPKWPRLRRPGATSTRANLL